MSDPKPIDVSEQRVHSAAVKADHIARKQSARAELWDMTGRQFASQEQKDEATGKVLAYEEAGYIDREQRDAVIQSLRVRPAPPTLSERRKAIEEQLEKPDSAYSMTAANFRKLWDAI